MRWINKNNGHYRRLAHKAIKSFMNMAWNEDLQRYVGCTFDDLRSQRKLTRILLQEQHYHCCYCMRRIGMKGGGKVTLEHIVPFKSKTKDFETYSFSMPRYFRRNVFWTTENKVAKEQRKLIVPPYPHFLSYENLSASCDGSIGNDLTLKSFANLHSSCNNYRGDDKIIPIFLFRKVRRKIRYASDGKMIYDSKLDKTIEHLNLDHPTLVLLRKTWYEISRYHNTEEVVSAIENHEIREEILEDTILTEPEQSSFLNNDMLWKLLTQYDWFYHYYKTMK